MQLFSVLEAEVPIISQLLHLQRASDLNARRAALAQLEAQGFTVRVVHGAYEAEREGCRYTLPLRRCPQCQQMHRLDTFITIRHREHPWCQPCRHAWPKLAERARTTRDYRLARGTLDLYAHERCANASCPSGGTMTLAQLRKRQKYCSRRCWRLVRSGPERQCANPNCSHLLRRDQKSYCSITCRMEHDRLQGRYQALPPGGTVAQQQDKAEHGPLPDRSALPLA